MGDAGLFLDVLPVKNPDSAGDVAVCGLGGAFWLKKLEIVGCLHRDFAEEGGEECGAIMTDGLGDSCRLE